MMAATEKKRKLTVIASALMRDFSRILLLEYENCFFMAGLLQLLIPRLIVNAQAAFSDCLDMAALT